MGEEATVQRWQSFVVAVRMDAPKQIGGLRLRLGFRVCLILNCVEIEIGVFYKSILELRLG